MKPTLTFTRDTKYVKKPTYLKKWSIFTLCTQKSYGLSALESKVEVNIKYETAKNKKKGHIENIEKGHNPAVFKTDMISLMPVETLSIN